MLKVAIVILNYLNYRDTIECVESIEKMQYSLCGIIIVDNASANESYSKLKKTYQNMKDIHIIRTRKNLGFAKGNNLGIQYARKSLGADCVLVVNNDTVFIQKDYINKLLNAYKKGVAVIGSRIILKNGMQFQVRGNFSLMDAFRIYINDFTALKGSCFDIPLKGSKQENMLHGCALMFTPDFFKHYSGFYPKTFLYYEESILHLMCKYKNLTQVYVDDAELFHKEDQSSELSFGNDALVLRKYIFQSEKYVIWWIFKNILKERKSTSQLQ